MQDQNPLRSAYPHIQWGTSDTSQGHTVRLTPGASGASHITVTPARRLESLRALCNGDSPELPGRRVALYLRSQAGREDEADAGFARLRVYARRRGWDVLAEYQEVVGFFPSGTDPAWEAVRLGVGTRFVHGVVTVDRDHISPDDRGYEDEVRAVCEGTGFLALLVPETATATATEPAPRSGASTRARPYVPDPDPDPDQPHEAVDVPDLLAGHPHGADRPRTDGGGHR